MPDFQRVQSPVFTPTACLACGTHHDRNGFVDLLVDQPVSGRAYLCGTCTFQAGRKVGCLDPEQSANLTARLAAATAEISALNNQLETERAAKVVSLDDVKKLLEPAVKRGPGRPPKAASTDDQAA